MDSQNAQAIVLPNPNVPMPIKVLYRLLANCHTGSLEIKVGQNKYLIQAEQRGPSASITIFHPLNMIKRFSRDGELGFAESYMNGDWESDDLSALLYWGALNLESLFDSLQANPLVKWFNRIRHLKRRNSEKGSKRNISAHYDLGNDFYQLWLDASMTYSSALFSLPNDSLEEAQDRKYLRLLESLDAKRGDHILEVGCGWGGFAEFAAKRGMRVTGLTLSTEQLKWAKKRIEKAGLSNLVELKLCDYRHEQGIYDHIVSIEMFEAVGESYWPSYFKMLFERLKPNGKAAIQVITIDEDYCDYYRNHVDFIQLYIFPGGMLPSPKVFTEQADKAGMQVSQAQDYCHDYELTLVRWHQKFNSVIGQVKALGYDDRFIRMWRYYLSYCEAGFRTEHTGVYQYVLTKPE
jgi:cyclopropane-fatty-acyl-phospholipid synthase